VLVVPYRPSMTLTRVLRRRRDRWALTEPSAVLLWELGMAWSSLAAVVDAATGRRIVLSGFVLLGPYCVLCTGRWLRTAVAGAWAIGLVVVLGIPDGIWGTRLQAILIGLAVFVAVSSTLALAITIRSCLSLTVTAFLATACAGQAPSAGRRPDAPTSRPVSCREQYETWKRGPGAAADRKLRAAVSTVHAAGTSGNVAALKSGMSSLMPAAVAAGLAGPVPHCADPAGLYARYVGTIYAAGNQARTAEGLSGLLKAAAPLKGLKAVETRLAAEIRRSVPEG
jgi:hypothetical protein